MKLRLLIIPALMATALFAQGPGGPRRGNASGTGTSTGTTTHTPPTAAQLAANQLTTIARYLKLDSAQTSALTASSLVAVLTTEETTLQGYAATLKTARTAHVASIVAGAPSTSAESTIESTNASILATRAAAAVQVLQALPGLGITVTSAQAAGLAQLLTGGGGFGGGFGGRR
jgi:type IV secretory pathway VirJ component